MRIQRVVAASLLAGAVLWPTAATAQAYTDGITDQRINSDPGDPGDAEIKGVVFERPAPVIDSSLAVTGSDVVQLTALGAGLTGLGIVLVRRSRRVSPATA